MTLSIKAFVMIVSLSAYVPMAGGINGDACIGRPWELCKVQNGEAACGSAYRGAVFILPASVALTYGFPRAITCTDAGGSVTNRHLDLARVGPLVALDLRLAALLGRREVRVEVYRSRAAWTWAQAQEKRLFMP